MACKHRFASLLVRIAMRLRGWPVMAGAEDPPSDDPPKDDPPAGDPPKDDPPADPDPDPVDDPPDPGLGKTADDYRKRLRDYERHAKKASDRDKKRIDALESKLKEREDADKSEQDKALEAAREEGRTAALTEAQKERRADRLEVAVTRLAARGVVVKDGDTEKTVKFADAEDALIFIERAIAKGDLDEDDVYDDDGKVKLDAITDELVDLLKRKPRLAAGDGSGSNGGGGSGTGRPAGGADAGRGKGGGTDYDSMTVEDHIKRKMIPQR